MLREDYSQSIEDSNTHNQDCYNQSTNIIIRQQDCYNFQEHCKETAKLLANFEESTTVEAEIIFDFQTLVEMDSLLEDMDTTLDELNEITQDYLWLSHVQTQVLTSTDNRNTTVTFQDLLEEDLDPKDTDNPRIDPPPVEGHLPGPPLDLGPDLVKYIQG